jgi:hypothetical protein
MQEIQPEKALIIYNQWQLIQIGSQLLCRATLIEYTGVAHALFSSTHNHPNTPRQPLEIPDRRHMCDCSMLCRLSCKPGHTRVRPALCISALAGPQAANEVHWGAHSLLLPAEVSSTSLQLPVGTHTLQHNLAWTRYCRMCMNKAPATMQIDGYGMPHEHRHTRHLLCCAVHTLSPRDPSSHPLP